MPISHHDSESGCHTNVTLDLTEKSIAEQGGRLPCDRSDPGQSLSGIGAVGHDMSQAASLSKKPAATC